MGEGLLERARQVLHPLHPPTLEAEGPRQRGEVRVGEVRLAPAALEHPLLEILDRAVAVVVDHEEHDRAAEYFAAVASSSTREDEPAVAHHGHALPSGSAICAPMAAGTRVAQRGGADRIEKGPRREHRVVPLHPVVHAGLVVHEDGVRRHRHAEDRGAGARPSPSSAPAVPRCHVSAAASPSRAPAGPWPSASSSPASPSSRVAHDAERRPCEQLADHLGVEVEVDQR